MFVIPKLYYMRKLSKATRDAIRSICTSPQLKEQERIEAIERLGLSAVKNDGEYYDKLNLIGLSGYYDGENIVRVSSRSFYTVQEVGNGRD